MKEESGGNKVDQFWEIYEWMNEWKRLLAEIKNIKLHTNNNIKQYIYQSYYQVTNNTYGNAKKREKLVFVFILELVQ